MYAGEIDERIAHMKNSPDVKAWLSPSAYLDVDGNIRALKWPRGGMGFVNRDALDPDENGSWADLGRKADFVQGLRTQ